MGPDKMAVKVACARLHTKGFTNYAPFPGIIPRDASEQCVEIFVTGGSLDGYSDGPPELRT